MVWDMVVSTLRFLTAPKQHAQVLEILRSVLGPTATQPGCLSCRIYEEYGAEESIVYCQSWESEAALHEHIRSDLYLALLAACELSNRAPEFGFHHVSRTQGMDLIHQLRGCSGESSPSS
ncbi:MAG: putative quinol monooxygenase [Verrucomicrobiia bacterium]